MKVAMVKHTPNGKVYWFEVPQNLASRIQQNAFVGCDTKCGRECGTIIGSIMDVKDVRDVMIASGAVFPLRKIIAIAESIPMDSILLPKRFLDTPPSDAKLAKRFLEHYRTGSFNTNVVISEDGYLIDGFSAYCVARKLNLNTIQALNYGASNYKSENL